MSTPEHYLKKRDLLWNPKTPAETLSATAREFLAKEAYSDALDFFERARDEAGLLEIKKYALAQGDAFLLARLERFSRELVSREEWERAAKAAEERGRASMSEYVRKKFEAASAAAAGAGAAPLEETGAVDGASFGPD